mmetsp:Transcript_40346/g.111133  ORF Transcript_40346/g.111133 Transcript_40346/m.111133 type:complete len:256 (-) Transcript_40346:7-774(-)
MTGLPTAPRRPSPPQAGAPHATKPPVVLTATKAHVLLVIHATPSANWAAASPRMPPKRASPQATTSPLSLRAAKAPSVRSIAMTPLANRAATLSELPPRPAWPQVTTLQLGLVLTSVSDKGPQPCWSTKVSSSNSCRVPFMSCATDHAGTTSPQVSEATPLPNALASRRSFFSSDAVVFAGRWAGPKRISPAMPRTTTLVSDMLLRHSLVGADRKAGVRADDRRLKRRWRRTLKSKPKSVHMRRLRRCHALATIA